MLRFRLSALFLLLFLSHLVFAVPVGGLYQAEVDVLDQSDDARLQGFESAFLSVISKLTGSSSEQSKAMVSGDLSKVSQFVQSFGYLDNPDLEVWLQEKALLESESTVADDEADLREALGLETVEPAEVIEPPAPFRLKVSFNKATLDAYLARRSIPILGVDRPAMMVFVAEQAQNRRRLISMESSDQQVIEALSQAAKRRGMPFTFPSNQLIDQAEIDSTDVWGLYLDAFGSSLNDLPADAVALVRLSQNDKGFDAKWVIGLRDSITEHRASDVDLDRFADEIADSFANLAAERFAVLPSASSNSSVVDLTVTGVNDYRAFIELENYLRSLPPVLDQSLQFVQRDALIYRLYLTADMDQLIEHIELAPMLKPEPLFLGPEEGVWSDMPVLRWQSTSS